MGRGYYRQWRKEETVGSRISAGGPCLKRGGRQRCGRREFYDDLFLSSVNFIVSYADALHTGPTERPSTQGAQVARDAEKAEKAKKVEDVAVKQEDKEDDGKSGSCGTRAPVRSGTRLLGKTARVVGWKPFYQSGDLVLKRIIPNFKDPRGKFAPNYEQALPTRPGIALASERRWGRSLVSLVAKGLFLLHHHLLLRLLHHHLLLRHCQGDQRRAPLAGCSLGGYVDLFITC